MADFNLSKWLKDDLGLKHMSEADMNSLIYHPRHGSLCRRLIKFWTESILCSRKYPNVYAWEDYEEATREFQTLDKAAQKLLLKLEARMLAKENTENELRFLKERHSNLISIEDMLRTNTEALEAIASRPNFSLEQVGRQLENPKYLGDLSLENIWLRFQDEQKRLSSNISKLKAPEHMITRRDMATASEDYEKLISKAQMMHQAISGVLTSVTQAMEQSEADISQVQQQTGDRTNVEQLLALKVQECEQEEIEADQEERRLRAERERLVRELTECNQQVNQLAAQYKTSKLESNARYKLELEKDLALLACIHSKEATLRGTATRSSVGGRGSSTTARN